MNIPINSNSQVSAAENTTSYTDGSSDSIISDSCSNMSVIRSINTSGPTTLNDQLPEVVAGIIDSNKIRKTTSGKIHANNIIIDSLQQSREEEYSESISINSGGRGEFDTKKKENNNNNNVIGDRFVKSDKKTTDSKDKDNVIDNNIDDKDKNDSDSDRDDYSIMDDEEDDGFILNVDDSVPNRKGLNAVNPKVYENKTEVFITGFDPTTEEFKQRQIKRVERFGKIRDSSLLLNEEAINDLYDSLGISISDLNNDDDDANHRDIRFDAVHLKGTSEMSTRDVFDYFKEFSPNGVEWIDDDSCNVIWFEKIGACRAMLQKSKRLTEEGKIEYEAVHNKEQTENDISGSILSNVSSKGRIRLSGNSSCTDVGATIKKLTEHKKNNNDKRTDVDKNDNGISDDFDFDSDNDSESDAHTVITDEEYDEVWKANNDEIERMEVDEPETSGTNRITVPSSSSRDKSISDKVEEKKRKILKENSNLSTLEEKEQEMENLKNEQSTNSEQIGTKISTNSEQIGTKISTNSEQIGTKMSTNCEQRRNKLNDLLKEKILEFENSDSEEEIKRKIFFSECWRVGSSHPKAGFLFMRFAKQRDRKQVGAGARSRYYQKYGNPSFGGIKGLISGSHKRRFIAKKRKREMEQIKKEIEELEWKSKGVPELTSFDKHLDQTVAEKDVHSRIRYYKGNYNNNLRDKDDLSSKEQDDEEYSDVKSSVSNEVSDSEEIIEQHHSPGSEDYENNPQSSVDYEDNGTSRRPKKAKLIKMKMYSDEIEQPITRCRITTHRIQEDRTSVIKSQRSTDIRSRLGRSGYTGDRNSRDNNSNSYHGDNIFLNNNNKYGNNTIFKNNNNNNGIRRSKGKNFESGKDENLFVNSDLRSNVDLRSRLNWR